VVLSASGDVLETARWRGEPLTTQRARLKGLWERHGKPPIALRKLAREAAFNGLLDPVAAQGIRDVRGAKIEGTRTGNWLTQRQAEALINHPDPATLKGRRDRAMLALMIGCGLRREEVARLRLEDVRQR
jgi:integrase